MLLHSVSHAYTAGADGQQATTNLPRPPLTCGGLQDCYLDKDGPVQAASQRIVYRCDRHENERDGVAHCHLRQGPWGELIGGVVWRESAGEGWNKHVSYAHAGHASPEHVRLQTQLWPLVQGWMLHGLSPYFSCNCDMLQDALLAL